MDLYDSRSASLEFRNLRNWIKGGIRQLIDSQLFSPVIRNKDRIWPNGSYNQNREDTLAATRYNPNTLSIIDLQFRCQLRMHFYVRFGTLLHQKPNAPGLIPRKILINDTTTRQYQRELLVRNFFGRVVFNGMKLRFSVRMIKTILKQARCPGMIFTGTRPENAVVLFDLFPTHAVVICIATSRSYAEFVEDLSG